MTQTMRERLQAKVADEVFEAVAGRLAEFEFVTDHEQERIDATARKVVDAFLAELRDLDFGRDYNLIMTGYAAGLGNIQLAFTAMIDAIRTGDET